MVSQTLDDSASGADPGRDDQSRPAPSPGTSLDVTDRIRAEEALAGERTLLRTLIDHQPDLVFVKDTQGRVTLCNATAAQYLGVPESAMLGKSVFDVNPPELARAYHEDDLRVLKHHEVIHNREELIRRHDGQERWHLTTKVPLRNSAGQVSGLIVICHDIHERKRAEETLRASEAQYRLLADNAEDFVLLNHVDGRRLYVSPSFYRVTGWTPDEFEAPDWRTRIHPDDLPLVERTRAANLAGQTTQIEYRMRCKNGAWLWVDTRCKPIAGPDGRVEQMQLWSRDITSRKRVEAEKESLEAQLRQAVKLEAVGRLAGGVAHDFNNLLGVMIGFAELACDEVAPSSLVHEYLQELLATASRSAAIIRQLLAFARREVIRPQTLDLNETVEALLKMLRRMLREDIELVWRPGAGLWPVFMDASQLDQILANLCVNARDAIAHVGTVTIETRNAVIDADFCATHPEFVAGDFVMLALSDTGCGMSGDVLDKIFEPFFTTKESGKGTGLGLATVYGAVKQNGGSISVASEPGRGTTFRIYLPRHHAPPSETPVARPVTMPRGRGEAVLVVEDEAALLNLIDIALRGLGYCVWTAQSPREALQVVEQQGLTLELLVTDVVMPEMNGKELSDRLRARYPQLKRLFISGYTADIIAEQGIVEQEIQLLQKPFSTLELATAVRAVLDEPSTMSRMNIRGD